MKITRKRIKKVYEKVTDVKIINQRREYSIKYRNVPIKKCIHLDENPIKFAFFKELLVCSFKFVH